MRIDAHHHIWELGRRPHAWLDDAGMAAVRRDFTVADLAPLTAAARIDRTILVQVLPSPDETAEFLTLAGEPGPVAGVVGWADLTSGHLPQALDALRSGPGGVHLVGIRHLVQGEPDPRWLARTDVRRGLRAVAAAGLVYDLLTLPHQMPAAIDTVRALPGLTFVLDHLSKPPIVLFNSNDRPPKPARSNSTIRGSPLGTITGAGRAGTSATITGAGTAAGFTCTVAS